MAHAIEQWKTISRFPEYEVSSHGRIRRATPGRRTSVGFILKARAKGGYPCVCLRKEGKRFDVPIHREVALAFIGKRPPGLEINHIDADKGNPRADNLEYVTHRENILHGIRMGRIPLPPSANVLNTEDVMHIRENPERKTGAELARQFGVSDSMISRIKNGTRHRPYPPVREALSSPAPKGIAHARSTAKRQRASQGSTAKAGSPSYVRRA